MVATQDLQQTIHVAKQHVMNVKIVKITMIYVANAEIVLYIVNAIIVAVVLQEMTKKYAQFVTELDTHVVNNTPIKCSICGKKTLIKKNFGILDVRVNLANGTVIDVEMQNVNQKNIAKRMTYYLSQLYASGIEKGEEYSKLKKTIGIAILNFKYFKDIEE